ncbi:MAG: GIY-YIG nuclease family protein [Longimonas sp.]|uniref:GIY-YIG nuclease family protein n=1 Tax=Longimonas sp. TaxID=2039626 RepID=UPI0033621C59
MRDNANSPLRDEQGTYVLCLTLEQKEQVQAGAKGDVLLHRGYYLYVGSAFGPGGVAARVRRHARTDHGLHWHIDYIRDVCRLQGVWVSYADTKRECPWARALLDADSTSVPKKGLGSSDCGCCAHFVRWGRAEKACWRPVRKQIEFTLVGSGSNESVEWIGAEHIA